MARVVPAALQHDAVRILRLQQRLQLRESQRQILLAVDDRVHSHDADGGPGDIQVHQQVKKEEKKRRPKFFISLC